LDPLQPRTHFTIYQIWFLQTILFLVNPTTVSVTDGWRQKKIFMTRADVKETEERTLVFEIICRR